MAEFINASPPPSSHLATLSRMGYSFLTAVGDILDNSISAKASDVKIYLLKQKDKYIFRLVDNGLGMSREELLKNMVIGCHDVHATRSDTDLGRFGSGLKTASFSQAEVLSVWSWLSHDKPHGAVWDTNYVREKNKWSLKVIEPNEPILIDDLSAYGFSSHGTIVRWDGITSLEAGATKKTIEEQVARIITELHDYIGLHFHRFLSKGLKISINDSEVPLIDPFMTKHLGYIEGPEENILSDEGAVRIKAHTLPRPSTLPDNVLRPYGGSKGVTTGQGLYIYRNYRLIVAGGWHGIMGASELGNLARIQIDIPSKMDWEWDTDVKKSRLKIPPRVRKVLRRVSPSVHKRSKVVHNYAGSVSTVSNCWQVIENERESGPVSYLLNLNADQLTLVFEELSSSAKKQLQQFFQDASEELPVQHIYASYSDRPTQTQKSEIVTEEIKKLLEALNA